MLEQLLTCPQPQCKGMASEGTGSTCPECRQSYQRCRVCRSTNRTFGAFCRQCGALLPEGRGTWTHCRQGSHRQGRVADSPFRVTAGRLLCDKRHSVNEEVQAGPLSAYGMVYILTTSGRVQEVSQGELVGGRSWMARGGETDYPSHPVIHRRQLFLYGLRTIEAIILHGDDNLNWIHELEPGWFFLPDSLLVVKSTLLILAHTDNGQRWRILTFQVPESGAPRPGWEQEITDSGYLAIPVEVEEHVAILSQSGGIWVYSPDSGKMERQNLRCLKGGFVHSVHPVAIKNHVFAVGQLASGPYRLIRLDANSPRPDGWEMGNLDLGIPQSIVVIDDGLVVSFPAGFLLLSQSGGPWDESTVPADQGAYPVSVGNLVLFMDRTRGILQPYVKEGTKVARLDPYRTDRQVPHAGVVPGGDYLFALRRDGVVERLRLDASPSA